MFKRKSLFLAAIAAAFVVPAPASAQRLAPMLYDLTPSGERSTQVLRLENNLPRAITIETVVLRREINPDGTETRIPADDDFIILPPQAVVQPNATQSFRIRYIGDQQIDRTRMYVISVNQLPVSTSEAQSLQFVVNFATAAYVTPQGLRPEIAVVSTEPGSDGRTVRVTVRNDGRKYASLALSTMTVRNAAGQTFSLEGDPLREALGLTVVPAGGSRVFTLPVPQDFTATGQVTTALRYDPLAGAN